jgi:prepilin-type N-terminal cleavage/methylation domain-containing protein
MNKKGFTLVELLAVIAILALLVIIALPNVLSMFNKAKKDTFLTEAKSIFKESASKYISDNMHNSNEGNIYCKSETDSKNPLDMDIGNTYYYIEKDNTGKTIKFVAWNSSGYVTKIVGDNVMLNDVTGNNVSESSVKDITCNNVLTNLEVISKLTKTYTINANASAETSNKGKLTISIASSNTTDEFNKVKYIIYKKNNTEYVKIHETVLTNKSNNFTLNYYDESFSNSKDMYYKVEAYTENNLKIGEKEFTHLFFCFVAGTKVKTENGFKNIEDIKIGEKVYSFNLDNNEIELKEVLELIHSSAKDTYKLTIGGKTVEMTSKHQVYIVDKGWTRAYNIKIGDMMLSASGDKVKITNIEHIKYDEPIDTYNLAVEDNSNYFVTDIQVLVHNVMPSKVS